MKRSMCVWVGLLILVSARLSSQVNTTSPSSIQVHKITLRRTPIEALDEISLKYRVVIGAYGTSVDYEPKLNISIESGTLKDVFDAITKCDPQLTWHEVNGMVHFVSRRKPLSLMDVVVDSFDADNPTSWDMYDLVSHVPAVHRWLLDHKCPRESSIMTTGSQQTEWGHFSVHARNVPLSSIFDEVAAKSRTYFWSVTQTSSHSCALNMQWREPDPGIEP